MKLIKILSFGLFVALTGCSSKVVTYDAVGRITGSCIAKSSFLLNAKALCYGYANQESLTFVEGQLVLPKHISDLPELPASRKVLIPQL